MNGLGTAARADRVRDAAGALTVRVVLLLFWGTPALLTRWRVASPVGAAESVRHNA